MDYAALLSISMQNIQFFLTVAEQGSMTKAASILNVTQPLLSQRICNLERCLELCLFERTPHALKLTPAGTYLYNEWQPLIGRISGSIEEARKIQLGVRNRISFGLYQAIGSTAKYQLSREIFTHFTEMQIDFQLIPLPQIQQQLYQHEVDVVLVPDYDHYEEKQGLSCCLVGSWPLCAIMSAKNPLAEKKSLTWADLADQVWLVESQVQRSGYERVLSKLSLAHQVEPRFQPMRGDETVQFYLQLNRGIAVVMSHYLHDDHTGTISVPIEDSDFPIMLVWNPDTFQEQKENFAQKAAPIIRQTFNAL